MRNLNYQLKQLCMNNRDGSYGTQSNRAWLLSLVANQLHDMGYRRMNAHSLKPKHVAALVEHWQANNISIGTQKNRLSVLRWWAKKIRKQNVVARDNTFYGIGSRQYVTKYSKSQDLDLNKLATIDDPNIKLSLKLQSVFGLRREEAIKFQPRYADQGDHLKLKSSWCKGGRGRVVPITTEEQRALLTEVDAQIKGGSLIPAHLTYVQQLRRYEGKTNRAGYSKLHGLRHGYAQRRFEALTGFHCPAKGGPTSKELTSEQRALNEKARAMISAELGHSREAITAVYLGR
jgi:integrase